MPTIHQITAHLEAIAPPSYQESYDNAGLITGSPDWEATSAVLSLDATEEVVEEAIALGSNMVIAHHPIVFRGLKKLNGKDYVERAVIRAIKHDVAIYAIHTNLDNVYHRGVNAKIAEKLGLRETRILAPKPGVKKLSVVVQPGQVEGLRAALFAEGAGNVNRADRASFATLGVGTAGGSGAAMMKLEVTFPDARLGAVMGVLQKNAPGAPFEITSLENQNLDLGAGLIGRLPKAEKEVDFLKKLKKTMQAGCIRHTRLLGREVRTVAVCGGAGSFLLPHALRQKADVFVTADYKYHEFFDADGRLVIADIGHYESEQFTAELLGEIIGEEFPTFAIHFAKTATNPVFYL